MSQSPSKFKNFSCIEEEILPFDTIYDTTTEELFLENCYYPWIISAIEHLKVLKSLKIELNRDGKEVLAIIVPLLKACSH